MLKLTSFIAQHVEPHSSVYKTLLCITLIRDQISDFNFHGNSRLLPLGQRKLDLQSALTVKMVFRLRGFDTSGTPVQMSMKFKLNAIVLYPWPCIDLSWVFTCSCLLHLGLPDLICSASKHNWIHCGTVQKNGISTLLWILIQ